MDDSESREHNPDDADEQIVSMVDVLNDEQQLQDDANAVLGACDENVCTYSQVGHLYNFCDDESLSSTAIAMITRLLAS